MSQKREPILRAQGPFLGMNTVQHPRELGTQFCVDAKNVLFSERDIQFRPPIRPLNQQGGTPFPPDLIPLSMFHWATESGSVILVTKAVHGQVGQVWALGLNQPGQTQLWSNLSPYPADFLEHDEWLYIFDSSPRAIKIHKTHGVRLVGILTPTLFQDVPGLPGEVEFGGIATTAEGGGVGARVQYAITYRDSQTNVESNPIISDPVTMSIDERFLFRIWKYNPTTGNQGINRLRVYRKNVSLNQTGFRLIIEHIANGSDTLEFFDDLHEDDIVLSSQEAGPFAPSKNGLPPKSRSAVLYKGRAFFGNPDSNRLYFSETNAPDHVADDDFFDLTGHGRVGVTGLREFSGQLAIGKPKMISVLSGVVRRHTNETIATAADPPPRSEDLRRTLATEGCHNGSGANGLVLAGKPARLMYNADSGLYEFDGTAELLRSKTISPLWTSWCRRKLSESNQAISYAYDNEQDHLYLCQSFFPASDQEFEGEQILVHHVGSGAWSYLRFDELATEFKNEPTCVASPVGDNFGFGPVNRGARALVMIGFTPSPSHATPYVLRDLSVDEQLDPVLGNLPMPKWAYQTGRMTFRDGSVFHLYAVEVFYNEMDEIPGIGPPFVLTYAFVDGKTGASVLKRVLLSNGIDARLRMGLRMRDVSLRFEKSSSWDTGWQSRSGITGFAFDAEPQGQR